MEACGGRGFRELEETSPCGSSRKITSVTLMQPSKHDRSSRSAESNNLYYRRKCNAADNGCVIQTQHFRYFFEGQLLALLILPMRANRTECDVRCESRTVLKGDCDLFRFSLNFGHTAAKAARQFRARGRHAHEGCALGISNCRSGFLGRAIEDALPEALADKAHKQAICSTSIRVV
jgi:hypothetical protein